MIPDFETNRLHIRLNYVGSAIFFSDARCTVGSVLGFTSDLNTEREVFQELKTVGIGLDVAALGEERRPYDINRRCLRPAARGALRQGRRDPRKVSEGGLVHRRRTRRRPGGLELAGALGVRGEHGVEGGLAGHRELVVGGPAPP